MKIFYSVEAYFPHISGVTIVTDRLATHFGRKKEDQVWVVTASASGDFKVEQTHKGYTILRIKSFPNPIRRKLRVSYLAKLEVSKILDKYQPDLIHLQDPLFISQASVISLSLSWVFLTFSIVAFIILSMFSNARSGLRIYWVAISSMLP